jgi:Cytochrome c
MRTARLVGMACIVLAQVASGAGPAILDRAAGEIGQRLYLQGVLPSGAPLEGAQPGVGVTLQGADAACVNCHQRSGLGSHEGSAWMPPVTGARLFSPRLLNAHEREMAEMGGPHGARGAYTESTLARAIRSGLDSEGRPFSELMPRYALDDAAMAALTTYLKQLSTHRPSGIAGAVVHLATVVTPNADPVKRRAVLDVLQHFVTERNAAPMKPGLLLGTAGTPGQTGALRLSNRHWQLHVWTLTGTPDSWTTQLDREFAAQPVFALLSGVGGRDWAPVHEFCERHGVPCFFPEVDVPVVTDQDFYSVYFSRGVLLEAQLIANSIAAAGTPTGLTAVHQIYRHGDSGEVAAEALAKELAATKFAVSSEALPTAATARVLRETVGRVSAGSILVLWLRSSDVAALAGSGPPTSRIYLSGLMSGGEYAPLPASWRAHTKLSYPFEVPQRRGVQLDYQLGWFALRHIPIVDMQAEADTFLACTLLTDAFKLMAQDVSAPYLIEQLHGLLEHRTLTGYYPRLALASGQRFASKGGYIVHFQAPQGTALVADTSWTVP